MTPQGEKQIRKWNETLSGRIEARLHVTEDRRSAAFIQFCDDLVGFAPNVTLVKEIDETEEFPAIGIGHRLRYQAIPLGRELPPFLEALSYLDGNPPEISGSHLDPLRKITLPARLKLYVTQQCPFCPQVVRQIIPLTLSNELIQLTIIDGNLFPDMAQADRIRAVPTLLLEKEFRWTGSLRLNEIIEALTNRDPVKLGPASLQNMVLEGNALLLADMMLARNQVFRAFLDLLISESFPVRLGAMAAMEQIAEKNPGLAVEVIEPLWERFASVQDQVKGDILYIFGMSQYDKMAPRLETILEGSYNDEVKEAAREALERIKK